MNNDTQNPCDTKRCDPWKICNPATGKCVLRAGRLGRQIIADTRERNHRQPSTKNISLGRITQIMSERAVASKGRDQEACAVVMGLGSSRMTWREAANPEAIRYCKQFKDDSARYERILRTRENAAQEVDQILERGSVDPTVVLKRAFETNKVDVCEVALRHGADPNATIGGRPVLLLAFERLTSAIDPEPMIILLVHAGADVNIYDDNGNPLLILAVLRQRPTILRMLLTRMDPNVVDRAKGLTALHTAASLGSVECVHELLHLKRTDPNVREPTAQRTPLHYAVLSGAPEDAKLRVVKALVSRRRMRPAKATLLDGYKMAPLHYAAQIDTGPIIKHLLDHCDVNIRDGSGYTPLFWAVHANNGAGVRAFVTYYSITGKANPQKSLSYAARTGRTDMVRLLLDAGAKPTELIFSEAMWSGQESVVRLFIERDPSLVTMERVMTAPTNSLRRFMTDVYFQQIVLPAAALSDQ